MRGGRLGGGAAVPEGTVVARVCPFDPAYWAFVDLCRECAGNRWLPRIELAADIEGGGSVVFLQFVAQVDHPVVKQFAEQWRARAGDAEFQEVRRVAQLYRAILGEQPPMLQAAPEHQICRRSRPTSCSATFILAATTCQSGRNVGAASAERLCTRPVRAGPGSSPRTLARPGRRPPSAVSVRERCPGLAGQPAIGASRPVPQ